MSPRRRASTSWRASNTTTHLDIPGAHKDRYKTPRFVVDLPARISAIVIGTEGPEIESL